MNASIRGFLIAALLMLAVVSTFSQSTVRSDMPAVKLKPVRTAKVLAAQPVSDINNPVQTLEFTIPFATSESVEYCLVIGCLNGQLRGNKVSISSETVSGPNMINELSLQSESVSALMHHQTWQNRYNELSSVQSLEINSSSRDFHMFMGNGRMNDARAYEAFPAALLAESEHLRIWCDQKDIKKLSHSVLQQQVKCITSTFEMIVVPELIPWLGQPEDIDQDGKFSVLLSSRLDGMQEDSSRLKGLTWGGDFRNDLSAPYGNQSDMVYLNPLNSDLDSMAAILVHEYVHAISFSRRCSVADQSDRGRITYEDDWLNEALSHVVETRLTGIGANIDYRLAEYESNPEAYPLVVSNYYQAEMWRNHGCRGAIYSFLDWCVDQEGERLIARLLHSSRTGIKNLEAATGKSFESLFQRWSVDQAGDHFRSVSALPQNEKNRRHFLSAGNNKTWQQASTSVKYLLLKTDQPGTYHYRIQCDPHVKLQLSLVSLEKDR